MLLEKLPFWFLGIRRIFLVSAGGFQRWWNVWLQKWCYWEVITFCLDENQSWSGTEEFYSSFQLNALSLSGNVIHPQWIKPISGINWNNCSHYYSCCYSNRIMFLHIYVTVYIKDLLNLCLSINTHFMHDLLLCWVSPFKQMTLAEKRLLGSRTSYSPLPLEMSLFTLCRHSSLWNDLTVNLPPIT